MLDQQAYFSPLPPQGKGEAAERALRSAIVHCMLAPGARLSEVALAREFGLGRGAVRAALARLQSSGFVAATARSGWSVTPVSAAEIRELGAARRQLEPLLCGVALDDNDRAHLHALSEMHAALMHRQELGGDVVSTIRRCEREILETLAARLGMPSVAGWLRDLWDRALRLVNFFEANAAVKHAPPDRSRFVEALMEGRRTDALSILASANSALETYLLDRFLESEATVASRHARKPAAKDKPFADGATRTSPGIIRT